MAARRLLAVLIALLIVSSLAAALAPQRSGEEDAEPTTETAEPVQGTQGAVLRERIPAAPSEPVELIAEPGDQLTITVEVEAPATVAIPDLGQTAFATPSDPARFDFLLRSEGRFPITVGTGERETVGVIAAGEAATGG